MLLHSGKPTLESVARALGCLHSQPLFKLTRYLLTSLCTYVVDFLSIFANYHNSGKVNKIMGTKE